MIYPVLLLFFILATLRLTGFLDWSWIWIASPLWILLAGCLLYLGWVCVQGFIDGFRRGWSE